MGRLYGQDAFRPSRLILMILYMQGVHTLVLGLAAFTLFALVGLDFYPAAVFSPQLVSTSDGGGWALIFASVIASIGTAVGLAYIVERAKKALDFVFTVYFWYAVACGVLGDGFSAAWWVVNLLCLIVATALGEFLCLRREMQDISVEDIMKTSRGRGGRKEVVHHSLERGGGQRGEGAASSSSTSGGGYARLQTRDMDVETGAGTGLPSTRVPVSGGPASVGRIGGAISTGAPPEAFTPLSSAPPSFSTMVAVSGGALASGAGSRPRQSSGGSVTSGSVVPGSSSSGLPHSRSSEHLGVAYGMDLGPLRGIFSETPRRGSMKAAAVGAAGGVDFVVPALRGGGSAGGGGATGSYASTPLNSARTDSLGVPPLGGSAASASSARGSQGVGSSVASVAGTPTGAAFAGGGALFPQAPPGSAQATMTRRNVPSVSRRRSSLTAGGSASSPAGGGGGHSASGVPAGGGTLFTSGHALHIGSNASASSGGSGMPRRGSRLGSESSAASAGVGGSAAGSSTAGSAATTAASAGPPGAVAGVPPGVPPKPEMSPRGKSKGGYRYDGDVGVGAGAAATSAPLAAAAAGGGSSGAGASSSSGGAGGPTTSSPSSSGGWGSFGSLFKSALTAVTGVEVEVTKKERASR